MTLISEQELPPPPSLLLLVGPFICHSPEGDPGNEGPRKSSPSLSLCVENANHTASSLCLGLSGTAAVPTLETAPVLAPGRWRSGCGPAPGPPVPHPVHCSLNVCLGLFCWRSCSVSAPGSRATMGGETHRRNLEMWAC